MSLNLVSDFSGFILEMDKSSVQKTYEFEDFRLDASQLLLFRDGVELPLPPKVIETLLVLVENGGKVVSKEQLLKAVWQDVVVEESNLYGYLHTIRNTLGDQKDGKPLIETLRRRGYRFNADVRVVPVTASEDHPLALDDIRHDTKQRRLIFWLSLGVLVTAGLFLAAFFWRSGPTTRAEVGNLRTLAILPFKPLAGENHDETLEIGMAGALISRLSGISEIEVRPMSSSRIFAGKDPDPIEVGNVLGADAVLEGYVQKTGSTVRIIVRLIKTADRTLVWESSFDGAYSDILAIQDEIANGIKAKVAPHLAINRARTGTANVEAWEYYVKGKYQIGLLTDSELKQSIENYRKAIDIDPTFAEAYAGLARAYVALPLATDFPPNESLLKAKDAALDALLIDGQSSESHAVYGSILFWYEWDWVGSEQQCLRAIQLDPHSAEARYIYAHLMSNLGRHPEALSSMGRARLLDPVNLRFDVLEAQFLIHAGQTEEALRRLQEAVERLPELWVAHLFISSGYIEKRMYAEAVFEADLARKHSGTSNQPAAFKGYALAKWGKKAEARKVLNELSRKAKEHFVPPYYFALIYNGLGETDKAILWLKRGIEQRDPKMVFLKVEPKWNNLRSDPRFIELLRKMNLHD